MARVTIEDCLRNVENRFKLVLLASKRARQLSKLSEPFVKCGRDKDTVIALREIAGGFVTDDNVESFQVKNDFQLEVANAEANNTE